MNRDEEPEDLNDADRVDIVHTAAKEDFEEDILPKLRTLAEVREVVHSWAARQGHDRCWYFPELLERLAKLLDVEVQKPTLPAPSEFLSECAKFYKSELGNDELLGEWKLETMPEVPKDHILVLNLKVSKLQEMLPWLKNDPIKFREFTEVYIRGLRDMYNQAKPGDLFIHTDLIEVEGVARLSFVPNVNLVTDGENPLDSEDKPVLP